VFDVLVCIDIVLMTSVCNIRGIFTAPVSTVSERQVHVILEAYLLLLFLLSVKDKCMS